MELSDFPVIRAFLVREPRGGGSESVNKFYKKFKEFEGMEKVLNELLNTRQGEQAIKFRDNNPEAAFIFDYKTGNWVSLKARSLRKVARMLSEARKIQQKFLNSPDLSPKQKRQKLNESNDAITRIARQALRMLPRP